MILGLMPFAVSVLLWLLLASWFRCRHGQFRRRESALIAWVVVGTWVLIGTELFSPFHRLSIKQVGLWWGLPAIGVAAAVWRRRATLRGFCTRPAEPLGAWGWALASATVLVLAGALVAALLSPPNNYDSLSYHLPRQVQWMQQYSVAHYPVNDVRQLEMPPLAEFMGLHLMILTAGDRFHNLVQWSALVVTLCAVTLTARDLGASRPGQWLAALLVATVPMVYLQASTTKNDVVAAAWGCAMAWWALRIWVERRCDPARAALVGLSAGLLVLTKGTAFTTGLPLGALVGAGLLRAFGWRRFWRPALVIGVLSLAVNVPHWTRNARWFGSPIGPSGTTYNNQVHTPAALGSVLLRNLAVELWTPWDAANRAIHRGVMAYHEWAGLAADDGRTTFYGMPFKVTYELTHEDMGPAPVLFVTALLLPLAAVAARRQLPRGAAFWALLAVPYVAFVLFCVTLKWQPWHPRLHVPILAAAAPVAAVVLDTRRWRVVAPLVAAAAVAGIAPYWVYGYRPIFGSHSVLRSEDLQMRFRSRPGLLLPSVNVASAVSGARAHRVAIVGGEWEYHLQHLLKAMNDRPPQLVPFSPLHGEGRVGYPPADVVIAEAHHWTHLRSSGDGQRYWAVAQYPPYTIYAAEGYVRRPAFDRDSIAFLGWDRSENLSDPEEPAAEWNLPYLRWALGPRTRLAFEAEGPGRMELVLDGRPPNLPGQVVTVRVNGEVVARQPMGSGFEFVSFRVLFDARAGGNDVTLEYNVWDRTDPWHQMAVFLRRLIIRPVEPTPTWPRGGGGEGAP